MATVTAELTTPALPGAKTFEASVDPAADRAEGTAMSGLIAGLRKVKDAANDQLTALIDAEKAEKAAAAAKRPRPAPAPKQAKSKKQKKGMKAAGEPLA